MTPDLWAVEHRGPEAPYAGTTAVRARDCAGPSTIAVVRGSTPTSEALVIDLAERDDAEQGYPWRWAVVHGDARRSGACQTRAQAESEGATVLMLLSRQGLAASGCRA